METIQISLYRRLHARFLWSWMIRLISTYRTREPANGLSPARNRRVSAPSPGNRAGCGCLTCQPGQGLGDEKTADARPGRAVGDPVAFALVQTDAVHLVLGALFSAFRQRACCCGLRNVRESSGGLPRSSAIVRPEWLHGGPGGRPRRSRPPPRTGVSGGRFSAYRRFASADRKAACRRSALIHAFWQRACCWPSRCSRMVWRASVKLSSRSCWMASQRTRW